MAERRGWLALPRWTRLGVTIFGAIVILGLIGSAVGDDEEDTIRTSTTTTTKPATTVATTTTTTVLPATTSPPPETTRAPVTTAGRAVRQGVTPGAFCTPEGAEGVTNAGVAMVCTVSGGESRPRWRAA